VRGAAGRRDGPAAAAHPAEPAWLQPAITLSFAALLVPLLLAPLPPLTDYPNNLARFWLLAHADRPPMPGVYAVTWDTLTNIGIDLLAVALSLVAEPEFAGRLITAVGILIVPLGGALLWRALHGRWHGWLAAFGLLAWSFELLDGFMNFRIGLGLALLATALEVARPSRSAWRAAAVRIGCGSAILLFHPFGFVFYGVLLCGVALGFRVPLQQHRAAWLRAPGPVVAALAVPLLAFLVVSPRLSGGGLHQAAGEMLEGFRQDLAAPGFKLVGLFTALRSYSNPADLLAASCLAVPVIASLAARRLTVHAGLLISVVACLVAYALCPFGLAQAQWVDRRFACMAPLALAAALRPDMRRGPALACTILLLGGSLLRTGYIAVAWQARQADQAALARTLAPLPQGAAVFAVEHRIGPALSPPLGRILTVGEPTFRHAVTLAIPWRTAFVPTLFAIRGQQPVRVLPPWDGLAALAGGSMVSVDALSHPEAYRDVIAANPFLAHWRDRMDYVVVLNADMPDVHGPFNAPPGLELVTDQGFSQLFRISR
jgi:hypothetical protein